MLNLTLNEANTALFLQSTKEKDQDYREEEKQSLEMHPVTVEPKGECNDCPTDEEDPAGLSVSYGSTLVQFFSITAATEFSPLPLRYEGPPRTFLAAWLCPGNGTPHRPASALCKNINILI